MVDTQLDLPRIQQQLTLLGSDTLDDAEAFTQLDVLIQHSFLVRERSGAILCAALATMKNRWDADHVPITQAERYDYKFHTYANQVCQQQYAVSTIDNMVDAGRVWLLNSTRLPAEVPLYDDQGEPTGDVVIPDPYQLGTSKLVFTKSAAKDGSLYDDEVALGQMFNPNVGPHTVLETLKGGNTKSDTDIATKAHSGRLSLYFEGTALMVREGQGKPEAVADFFFGDSPLVDRAIKLVAAACQITGW